MIKVRFLMGQASIFDAVFFYKYLFQNKFWREKFFKMYPELKTLKQNAEKQKLSENQKRKLIIKFISQTYRQRHKKIINSIRKYQKYWNRVNNKFIKTISEVLETSPPKIKIIKAYVSINPINPRDISNSTYSINYKFNKRRVLKTSAHEITHFFYFKKLKETYPGLNTETFNRPYKNWIISEILAPIILNDPRIAKIIGETEKISYICNRKTSDKFWNKYTEHLNKGTSFKEFYESVKNIKISSTL